MSAGANALPHLRDIPTAVGGLREEVEEGAIVPQIVAVAWQIGDQNIGLHPGDARRRGAKPLLRVAERDGREIQDRHVLVPGREEAVDERGRAPADVENA